MATTVIPTRSDAAHYAMDVDLDGRPFNLEFRWNERAAAWLLTISDVAGNVLLAGRRVVVDLPLLARFRDPRLPAGDLIAVDMDGAGTEATFDELGGRVRLLYFDAAELAAARG